MYIPYAYHLFCKEDGCIFRFFQPCLVKCSCSQYVILCTSAYDLESCVPLATLYRGYVIIISDRSCVFGTLQIQVFQLIVDVKLISTWPRYESLCSGGVYLAASQQRSYAMEDTLESVKYVVIPVLQTTCRVFVICWCVGMNCLLFVTILTTCKYYSYLDPDWYDK